MLGDQPTSSYMDEQVCSLWFAVEGIMTTLFSRSDFDWATDNSLVEPPMTPTKEEEARPTLSPQQVCKLWKTKRREENINVDETRQQSVLCDLELQSETKQNAQVIQRTYEKRFDDSDYSQRYEKYGSRADFIRDRRL